MYYFFDLLESNIAKFVFTPDKILNEDESGFSTVQKRPQKIVTQKGKYQVGVAASGERGVSSRPDALRRAVYRQSVRLGDKPLETHEKYFFNCTLAVIVLR
jgi:hypothetical protein